MTLRVYEDLEQGTEAWLAARRGMVTASVVGQLLTAESPDPTTVACLACNVESGPCISLASKKPTKLKTVHSPRARAASEMPSVVKPANNDTSARLALTLIAERITGHTEETRMTDDMWRGVLDEPIARDVYSGHYEQATEVGFLVRDDWGFSIGYSPDGLVGDDGLIEVKSPRAKEHLRTILADEVPERYMAQLQCGLLVSGREWIDYVSFSGGMPLWTKRVLPDPKWAEAIVDAVAAFEQTAAEMTENYETATRGLPATERRIDPSEIQVA